MLNYQKTMLLTGFEIYSNTRFLEYYKTDIKFKAFYKKKIKKALNGSRKFKNHK